MHLFVCLSVCSCWRLANRFINGPSLRCKQWCKRTFCRTKRKQESLASKKFAGIEIVASNVSSFCHHLSVCVLPAYQPQVIIDVILRYQKSETKPSKKSHTTIHSATDLANFIRFIHKSVCPFDSEHNVKVAGSRQILTDRMQVDRKMMTEGNKIAYVHEFLSVVPWVCIVVVYQSAFGDARYVPDLHVVFNLRNPLDTSKSGSVVEFVSYLCLECCCLRLICFLDVSLHARVLLLFSDASQRARWPP